MTKGGFLSFYKSRFKSKTRTTDPNSSPKDTENSATTSEPKLFPRTSNYGRQDVNLEAFPAISLPRTPDYYGGEAVKSLVTISPKVCPRKSKSGNEDAESDEHSWINTKLDDAGEKLVVMQTSRRSVSQVETSLVSVIAFLQVKVLVSDMPGSMQIHAFRCARRTYDSLDKLSSKFIAYNLKKEFDKVYGPAWHCIVGSSFGSFVTHATGGFLYFSMDKFYILLFNTRVKRTPT